MNPFALAAGAIGIAAGFGMPCTASTDKQASPRSSAQANAAPSGSTSGEASSAHAKAKKPGQPTVSEASARRIAWRSGVDHIEEIILSGERWEVSGRDRIGNEKALDIHAYDGSVLN